MTNFTSTKLFKAIIVGIVFSFVVAINPYGIFKPVRNAVSFFISPIQKGIYVLTIKSSGIKDFISSIGQLKKENENLTQENQKLLAQNVKLADIEKENEILREQLELLPREKFDLIAARIISQDPGGLGNWMQIDKGSDDGLSEGMPVIVSNSILIGKIADVSAHSSNVALLTNPKSAINVVTSDTGAKGIIKGEYGLGIIDDMILQTDTINVGSQVITSGIGSNIPKGFLVGIISEVHPSEDHLFQQASINSPINVSKLQFVFAVKGNK